MKNAIRLTFLKLIISITELWRLAFFGPSNRIARTYFFYNRSSRPEVFCKNDVLKIFVNFTGKHICKILFFDQVPGLRPVTFLRKNSGTCVILQKFYLQPFFTENLQRLLLLQQ